SAADFGVLIFRMDFSFHTKAKEDSSQPRADKGFFGKSARPSGGISEPSSRESLCNRKRDMLGFQEGVHSLDAEFAAPAALFNSAERGLAGGGHAVVDAHHARLDRLHEPESAVQI